IECEGVWLSSHGGHGDLYAEAAAGVRQLEHAVVECIGAEDVSVGVHCNAVGAVQAGEGEGDQRAVSTSRPRHLIARTVAIVGKVNIPESIDENLHGLTEWLRVQRHRGLRSVCAAGPRDLDHAEVGLIADIDVSAAIHGYAEGIVIAAANRNRRAVCGARLCHLEYAIGARTEV